MFLPSLNTSPILSNASWKYQTNLAQQLCGSQKLRVLSLGVAWDEEHDLRSHIASHELAIYGAESNRPTEHTGSFYECMTCIKTYDHGAVIHKECVATQRLAEALPSLQRISWTNAWGPIKEDEGGQRAIFIIRNGRKIVLRREDWL